MEWDEWHGEQAKALVKQAAIEALLDCGDDLKGKSQDEAPVDLGDLKGNCNVSDPEESSGDITVTVGYSLPTLSGSMNILNITIPRAAKPNIWKIHIRGMCPGTRTLSVKISRKLWGIDYA